MTPDIKSALMSAPFAAIAALWRTLEEEGHAAGPQVLQEVQRWLARNDRYYLFVRVLNAHYGVHPWIYARCREVEQDPDGYLDLWAREHFKSSLITYAGSIQLVINDPTVTIGIFSHTKPIAKGFLRQIQREFDSNETLKSLYPEIFWENPSRDAPSWSLDNGITVNRASNPREATIEAHGLVDGQPTSRHFKYLLYDDVVTLESVSTAEQIEKTTKAWELSDNLGAVGGHKWHVGTRYCTVGGTKILMADWTHKNIEDVCIGDSVIGWEQKRQTGDGPMRPVLKSVKVLAVGAHAAQSVNQYMFDHGRSVTCTPDHKWWRGGERYSPLATPISGLRHGHPSHTYTGNRVANGYMSTIRELLVPVEKDTGRDAGWLAGFFDGEGTIKKNTNHASGAISISQTMHNPGLIEECRAVLKRLGFAHDECWNDQSKGPTPTWSDRCIFGILGGWRERYRFLMQIYPARRAALEATLFSTMLTERRKVIACESRGLQDVFWLETESGNYIADGFCSKNSYADSYEEMIKRKAVKVRLYPATDDGTITGKPVYFSLETWKKKVRDQGEATISCQMLQNPLAGQQRMFDVTDFRIYEVRPEVLNVYITVDPARSKKKGSANTAIMVQGVDYAMNKYLLDGFNHKMDLRERWQRTAQMYHKWKRQPGVQNVKVGYEAFGAQADLDYFTEQMTKPTSAGEGGFFPIEELMWPREGEGSKSDRVQRLGPDLRAHRYYLPYDTDEKNLTKIQRDMLNTGYKHRIAMPIRRKDGTGEIYDLAAQFKLQIHFFPFGGQKDAADAASRIYDLEPHAPNLQEVGYLEPEYT